MNLYVTQPGWLAVLLSMLFVLAAAEDALRMRISNLTIVGILAGAIVAAIHAGPTIALWQNLTLCIGFLALGTPAFAAGKLGGGDIKLIAASGAWFDLQGGLLMVICTLLAGGLLAFFVLLLRLVSWPGNIRQRVTVLRPGSGIPYGVAIVGGSLIAMGLKWN